jgi:hypothetical protein
MLGLQESSKLSCQPPGNLLTGGQGRTRVAANGEGGFNRRKVEAIIVHFGSLFVLCTPKRPPLQPPTPPVRLRAEGTPDTVRKWTSSVEELETADRYRSAGQKTNKPSSHIHRATIRRRGHKCRRRHLVAGDSRVRCRHPAAVEGILVTDIWQ